MDKKEIPKWFRAIAVFFFAAGLILATTLILALFNMPPITPLHLPLYIFLWCAAIALIVYGWEWWHGRPMI